MLWKSKGKLSCHSKDEDWWSDTITERWETKASQTIKIKSNTETKDIIDPTEETIFHLTIISG